MTTELNQNVLWSVNSYVTGCATEAFGNTCVVLTEDFGGVGGCPVSVAQWQSTGGSRQKCPGFNSRRLLTFSIFTSI